MKDAETRNMGEVPLSPNQDNSLEDDSGAPKPRFPAPPTQAKRYWQNTNTNSNPNEQVNSMPGGTWNTAGGKPREPSFWEAAESISLEDFNNLYKAPCARETFMTGIGSGFALGGVRGVLGGECF